MFRQMKKISIIIIALSVIVLVGGLPLKAKAAGDTQIHIITIDGQDAILLESNGRFGMVDSGEDSDYPDGSDSRYPWREGIVIDGGSEEHVISYMKSVGVTKDNFEFYIGTHPHSDHIGSADEVIREFSPERVYIMEYRDEYISTDGGLFDNLYIYDQMLEAAKEVGAVIIQNFSESAPIIPEQSYEDITEPSMPEENQKVDNRSVKEVTQESIIEMYALDEGEVNQGRNKEELPDEGVTIVDDNRLNSVALGTNPATTGNPKFTFGEMKLEIMNYSDDYKTNPKPDANYFSLGVKVTIGNQTMFLSGDIGAYDGDEIRLASALGHVDALKLGHHGLSGSNSEPYMEALSPDVVVQTGTYLNLAENIIQTQNQNQGKIYSLADVSGLTSALQMNFDRNITTNIDEHIVYMSREKTPYLTCFQGGLPKQNQGFVDFKNDWYYFRDDSYALENEWVEDDDETYYMGNDGKMEAGGWITVDKKDYYVDESGRLLTNQEIDGYYVDEDGVKVSGNSGWKYENGTWYYVDVQGKKATGWQYIGGAWYYFNHQYEMKTGWQYENGAWYYMNASGVMLSNQWIWSSGKCYYLSGSGAMVTEQWINGSYVDASGAWVDGYQKPSAGWSCREGIWYYITDGGNYATGWQYIGGSWYYFDNQYRMATGWQYINGAWYCMNSSGAMYANRWLWSGNHCYYLSASGAMATNQWVNGNYVDASGVWISGLSDITTGWQHVTNGWYYTPWSGHVATGWQAVSGTWYYMNENGLMHTGWRMVDGVWYYLLDWGGMATGWRIVNNEWYYFDGSGVMRTGWQFVNGSWYYMDSSGKMLSSQWIEEYYVDSSGAWIPDYAEAEEGWKEKDGHKYYYDKKGQLITNQWLKIDGEFYFFYHTGTMASDQWLWYAGKCYYLHKDGHMVTEQWVEWEDKYYYLSEDGTMLVDTWVDGYYVDGTGVRVEQ